MTLPADSRGGDAGAGGLRGTTAAKAPCGRHERGGTSVGYRTKVKVLCGTDAPKSTNLNHWATRQL